MQVIKNAILKRAAFNFSNHCVCKTLCFSNLLVFFGTDWFVIFGRVQESEINRGCVFSITEVTTNAGAKSFGETGKL